MRKKITALVLATAMALATPFSASATWEKSTGENWQWIENNRLQTGWKWIDQT